MDRLIARFGAAASVLVLALGSTLVAAPTALASASGCGSWGQTIIKGVTVDTGRYCVSVGGSGTFVQGVAGNFTAYIPVCNWSITAEFFNSRSQWYQTMTSATHYSCSLRGSDGIYVGGNRQSGFVCSTLRQNGARLTSWCAAIHP